MKLPFVDRAEISEAKIVNYLLSATHRAGKSKASFLCSLGLSRLDGRNSLMP
jgi:uncharacterized protein DUF6883